MTKQEDEALAEHNRLMQEWVARLWADFDEGTVIQRLRKLVTTCDMVARRGPNMRRDTELRIETLLNEWGPARLVKALAMAAEGDAQDEIRAR